MNRKTDFYSYTELNRIEICSWIKSTLFSLNRPPLSKMCHGYNWQRTVQIDYWVCQCCMLHDFQRLCGFDLIPAEDGCRKVTLLLVYEREFVKISWTGGWVINISYVLRMSVLPSSWCSTLLLLNVSRDSCIASKHYVICMQCLCACFLWSQHTYLLLTKCCVSQC